MRGFSRTVQCFLQFSKQASEWERRFENDEANGSSFQDDDHEIRDRVTKPEYSFSMSDHSKSPVDLVHDPFYPLRIFFPDNSWSIQLIHSNLLLPHSQSFPSSTASVPSTAIYEMKTLPAAKTKTQKTSAAKSSLNIRNSSSKSKSTLTLTSAEMEVVKIINEVYQDTNENYYFSVLLHIPNDFQQKKKKNHLGKRL